MDLWLFWPTLTSLGIVTIVTFICTVPGDVSFLMIPVSFLVYAILSIGALVATVISSIKKRPKRAISFLLIVVTPIFLWSPIRWVADCAHLWLTVEYGAGQLGSSSKPDGKSFAAYDWSVGLAGGPNTFLIYDNSDQIALPVVQKNGWEDCAGRVRHVLGHYYVCTI